MGLEYIPVYLTTSTKTSKKGTMRSAFVPHMTICCGMSREDKKRQKVSKSAPSFPDFDNASPCPIFIMV